MSVCVQKAASTMLPAQAQYHVNVQSGCSLCVWDMYRDNLHEYRVQQAMLRGERPPVKSLDPFEEMELRLNNLADEGKGPKAAEREPSSS